MNCTECGTPVAGASDETRCAACASEEAMYAAYTREIAVPPMWEAIEARLQQEPLQEEWRQRASRRARPLFATAAAAVAAIALVTVGMMAVRTMTFDGHAPQLEGSQRNASPALIAAAHYRQAIEKLEPNAGAAASALLPPLTSAIDAAERDAALAPDDPLAVTRAVAAYDAKLQLLRAYAHD